MESFNKKIITDKINEIQRNEWKYYLRSPGKQKEVAFDMLSVLKGERLPIPYGLRYFTNPLYYVISDFTGIGNTFMNKYLFNLDLPERTVALEYLDNQKKNCRKGIEFSELLKYVDESSVYALCNNIIVHTDEMYIYYRLHGIYGHDKTWNVSLNPNLKRTAIVKAQPIKDYIEDIPVTNMSGLFRNCYCLTEIDGVIPNTILYANHAFENTSLLKYPTLPSNIIDTNYMFSGCHGFTYDGSNEKCGYFTKYIIPDSASSVKGMFAGNKNMIVSPRISTHVHNADNMYENCSKLEVITDSKTLFKVNSLSGFVNGCKKINSVDSDIIKKANSVDVKRLQTLLLNFI